MDGEGEDNPVGGEGEAPVPMEAAEGHEHPVEPAAPEILDGVAAAGPPGNVEAAIFCYVIAADPPGNIEAALVDGVAAAMLVLLVISKLI